MPDAPVRVDISLRPLAGIQLARIDASPLHLATPADEDDLLYLSVARAGSGVIDALGNARAVKPGDFNVMLRDRHCVTVVDEASTILSLALPRALVEQRLSSVDRLRGPFPVNAGAARLLGDYAAAIVASGELDAAAQTAAAGHIVDLVVLALGATRDDEHAARGGGVRAARRRAVKADISANLGDPRLTVDWIARRHGVNSTTIRALFYDEGTSFSDFLRSARLDRVRTLLQSPFMAAETVASLALMSGFNDIAWFNQAFKRRFGMTPSEMRRQKGARGPG